MAIIQSKIKAGQKPSETELQRINAELETASKKQIVYDTDSPKLSPAVLQEFAAMRAHQQQRKQGVSHSIQVLGTDCADAPVLRQGQIVIARGLCSLPSLREARSASKQSSEGACNGEMCVIRRLPEDGGLLCVWASSSLRFCPRA